MDTKQRDRILSVIKRDAAIRYSYVNGQGEFCIIGGLLDEMGVDVKRELFRTRKNRVGVQSLYWHFPMLKEVFGLNLRQLNNLQEINDTTTSRIIRQDKLRRLVDAMSVEVTE